MKQLEIKTNRRLLIVESENFDESQLKEEFKITLFQNGNVLKFICKGSELTEDIAKGFQHQNMRIAHNGEYLSAIEEFKFHLSNHGYHWGENPVKRPIKDASKCAKWHIKAFEKKQKEWQESESRTFNPSKCIIFEIV